MWNRGNPDGPAGPPPQQPDPASSGSSYPSPAPQVRHDFAQAARLATTPMPYDIAATHEPVIVYVSGTAHVGDPSALLTSVFDELAREASRRGCDGVYGVHHTFAVDAGVMYITAAGTGSRPITNMDEPPTP